MTILTKAITEKKFGGDKLDDQPLVQNEVNEAMPAALMTKSVAIECPAHTYLARTTRARRVNTATTICACITAILVLTIGVIGGVYVYKQLARAQMHRVRAWCKVPYPQDLETIYGGGNGGGGRNNHIAQAKQTTGCLDYHDHMGDADSFDKETALAAVGNVASHPFYFNEGFEIDIEYQLYEEITVPDFSGGRRGRFIHDFSANKTGIIDLDGRRCFVLPLNRSLVLPPQSLFDLVLKMKAGYYEVDTEVVRETMFIVYPKITDYKSVGYYIARECASLSTYMLRKVPKSRRGLGKRSTDDQGDAIAFTEFAGKKIVQFTIIDNEMLKD